MGDVRAVLEELRRDAAFMANVTHWEVLPPREARLAPFPAELDRRLVDVLTEKGISALYTHQRAAFDATRRGEHIVVVTPTASGKTLCYNLPVLQAILEDDHTRALYIFPTKALAYDQMAELNDLIARLGVDIKSYTYDGDTPASARQAIRNAGHIVVTNPDMLHSAILPHHTKWVKLFENLRFVVIDELHAYRGVFGSHVANVLRRLKRICRFYGSNPQFLLASATIANPRQHAEALIEEAVTLIDENGAPRGEKHFIFYNPPVVNKPLGIRKSSVLESRDLALRMLKKEIQTIVFARSRVRVEVLTSYLQEAFKHKVGKTRIRGYRGGYLPKERREIERGLRSGEILGVVSTNALELGVDIGQLEACILSGYPGSIASTWQQAGRAGRRYGTSVAILVASSNPLDQFLIQNPAFFFGRSPEEARIDPDNLMILVDHIKCAAFELPFRRGESFGGEDLEEILSYLAEEQVVHAGPDRWYWMADAFPAHEISLRSAARENVVIVDITEGAKVIGEVDRFSAPMLVHEEAIYIHDGVQYQVEKLDYEEKKAYVRRVKVDYYTDANLAVDLKVLTVDREEHLGSVTKGCGEVMVTAMATLFKKIRFHTHENVGSGPIHLPEEELHTTAYWIALDDAATAALPKADLPFALLGLANVLVHTAPLFLMCDPLDIRVVPQVKAVATGRPTIFLYDRYPGGVGLAERLYERHEELLAQAETLIRGCGCEGGCPACVGPVQEVGPLGKRHALALLEAVRGTTHGQPA
ncbi:ATP-dependent helicase MrfA [Calditerricola yamamurae]